MEHVPHQAPTINDMLQCREYGAPIRQHSSALAWKPRAGKTKRLCMEMCLYHAHTGLGPSVVQQEKFIAKFAQLLRQNQSQDAPEWKRMVPGCQGP